MATKTNTYVNGQTADGGQIETDLNELYANITNSNIASSAAIATTKLELGNSSTGSSTAIYLANNVGITFLSNSATSSTIKQSTSNDIQLTIGTAAKSFIIYNSASASIFQLDTNSTFLGLLKGYALRVYDPIDTKYGAISHDGTNVFITHTGVGRMNFGVNTAGQGFDFDYASANEWIKIPNLAGDPGSLENGMIWYNSTSGTFNCRQAGATKTFTVA